ncbi:MAG: hypothetical protein CL678_03270 [Bdellovibrionaceae bacterium]|nr:hypothetical protein [Pseudobdellovibrionaceae bacterium]|tara:strand:+ start:308 stop:796 length:489 start_codon:yes stop_codon:yes gene_type:complete
MSACSCGLGPSYENCCLPIIQGKKIAETAEQLMRSRYSAYVHSELKYLFDSLHPKSRGDFDEQGVKEWANQAQWEGLEILSTDQGQQGDAVGTVEFIARYKMGDKEESHHETATFERNKEGHWSFMDGKVNVTAPIRRTEEKIGRNDPCSCGSGKKFKKCCG